MISYSYNQLLSDIVIGIDMDYSCVIIGITSPLPSTSFFCEVNGIKFLHVCIYHSGLEQAEPYRSFRIAVYHSDIVISKVIVLYAYDAYVPACEHIVLAAIQLIMVKVKGVDHVSIYSEAARENFLAAKQQRSKFCREFLH